jgi:hypothetical protein
MRCKMLLWDKNILVDILLGMLGGGCFLKPDPDLVLIILVPTKRSESVWIRISSTGYATKPYRHFIEVSPTDTS